MGTPVGNEAERLAVQLWRSRQVPEILAVGMALAEHDASGALSHGMAAAWLAAGHWVGSSGAAPTKRGKAIEASLAVILDGIARLIDARTLAEAASWSNSTVTLERQRGSKDTHLKHRRIAVASRQIAQWHLSGPGQVLQMTSPADVAAAKTLENKGKAGSAIHGASLQQMFDPPSAQLSTTMIGGLLRSFMAMPHDSGVPAALAAARVAWTRYGVLPPAADHAALVGRAADLDLSAAALGGTQPASGGGGTGTGGHVSSHGTTTGQSLPLSGPGSPAWRLAVWGKYEQELTAWLQALLAARGLHEPPALARARLRQLCQRALPSSKAVGASSSPEVEDTIDVASTPVSTDAILDAYRDTLTAAGSGRATSGAAGSSNAGEHPALLDSDSLSTTVQCLVSMGAHGHAAAAVRLAQEQVAQVAGDLRLGADVVDDASGLPRGMMADWLEAFAVPADALGAAARALAEADELDEAMLLLAGAAGRQAGASQPASGWSMASTEEGSTSASSSPLASLLSSLGYASHVYGGIMQWQRDAGGRAAERSGAGTLQLGSLRSTQHSARAMRMHREAMVGHTIRLLLQAGRPDQAMNVLTTMRPSAVQEPSVLFALCKAMVEQQEWRKLRLLGTFFEIGTKHRGGAQHVHPDDMAAAEGARAAICIGSAASGDINGLLQHLQSGSAARPDDLQVANPSAAAISTKTTRALVAGALGVAQVGSTSKSKGAGVTMPPALKRLSITLIGEAGDAAARAALVSVYGQDDEAAGVLPPGLKPASWAGPTVLVSSEPAGQQSSPRVQALYRPHDLARPSNVSPGSTGGGVQIPLVVPAGDRQWEAWLQAHRMGPIEWAAGLAGKHRELLAGNSIAPSLQDTSPMQVLSPSEILALDVGQYRSGQKRAPPVEQLLQSPPVSSKGTKNADFARLPPLAAILLEAAARDAQQATELRNSAGNPAHEAAKKACADAILRAARAVNREGKNVRPVDAVMLLLERGCYAEAAAELSAVIAQCTGAARDGEPRRQPPQLPWWLPSVVFSAAAQAGAVVEACTLLTTLLQQNARRVAMVMHVGASQEAYQLGVLALAVQNHHAQAAEMLLQFHRHGLIGALGGEDFCTDVLQACFPSDGDYSMSLSSTSGWNRRSLSSNACRRRDDEGLHVILRKAGGSNSGKISDHTPASTTPVSIQVVGSQTTSASSEYLRLPPLPGTAGAASARRAVPLVTVEGHEQGGKSMTWKDTPALAIWRLCHAHRRPAARQRVRAGRRDTGGPTTLSSVDAAALRQLSRCGDGWGVGRVMMGSAIQQLKRHETEATQSESSVVSDSDFSFDVSPLVRGELSDASSCGASVRSAALEYMIGETPNSDRQAQLTQVCQKAAKQYDAALWQRIRAALEERIGKHSVGDGFASRPVFKLSLAGQTEGTTSTENRGIGRFPPIWRVIKAVHSIEKPPTRMPVLQVAQQTLAAVLDGDDAPLPPSLGQVPIPDQPASGQKSSGPSAMLPTPLFDMVSAQGLPGEARDSHTWNHRVLQQLCDQLEKSVADGVPSAAAVVIAASVGWSSAVLGVSIDPKSLGTVVSVLAAARRQGMEHPLFVQAGAGGPALKGDSSELYNKASALQELHTQWQDMIMTSSMAVLQGIVSSRHPLASAEQWDDAIQLGLQTELSARECAVMVESAINGGFLPSRDHLESVSALLREIGDSKPAGILAVLAGNSQHSATALEDFRACWPEAAQQRFVSAHLDPHGGTMEVRVGAWPGCIRSADLGEPDPSGVVVDRKTSGVSKAGIAHGVEDSNEAEASIESPHGSIGEAEGAPQPQRDATATAAGLSDPEAIPMPSGLEALLAKLEAEDAVYRRRPLVGGPEDVEALAELPDLGLDVDLQGMDGRWGPGDAGEGRVSGGLMEPRGAVGDSSSEDESGSDSDSDSETMDVQAGAPLWGERAGWSGRDFQVSKFAPLASSGQDRAATGPDAQAALSVGWWTSVQKRVSRGLELQRRRAGVSSAMEERLAEDASQHPWAASGLGQSSILSGQSSPASRGRQ